MKQRHVVISGAIRTPIGKFNGSLAAYSAVELISQTGLLQALLRRCQLTGADVNEVILGNVLNAGLGQNVARQVALGSDLPVEVPALTVNRVCASGMTAIDLGARLIATGGADVVIAGGTESMSNAAYALPRKQTKFGNLTLRDTMISDGLWDAFYDCHMGITAENIAAQWNIAREQQDNYAVASHKKAIAASQAKHFQAEIHPSAMPNPKKSSAAPRYVTADEGPRADTSLAQLAQLKPAFKPTGTVTAANAASINDGAALVLLTHTAYAEERKLPILAKILAATTVGFEPKLMGHAPYQALKTLSQQTDVPLATIDIFELNEAFAAQCLSVVQDLNLPAEKINVNGGAIALGHPIGASGARIVVTLLHALKRLDKRLGMASLCVGGGQGTAMLIENVVT